MRIREPSKATAYNQATLKSRRYLHALNFFMADMQAGMGPFLGVFLQGKGWQTGQIGQVMTLGGLAGMLFGAPAGALVDATRRKRECIVVSGLLTLLASGLLFLSQSYWVVVGSQMATAIVGAAIGPAVAGITLGMFRQSGFTHQNGVNQAYNHAGNVVGAALSGYLGWKYGFVAVFWLAAAFGALSVWSVLQIPEAEIDHQAARGLEGEDLSDGQSLRQLWDNLPLRMLGLALAFFHLGNAAMLPLYGLSLVAAHQGDPAALTAKTIVVAQLVMVAVSLVATGVAEKRGYWLVLLVSFLALPLRGLIAALFIQHWGIYPVQILDGVGAGLQSVAVPGLVARILAGTGRVNLGQGAVATIQAIGGCLSPLLGYWVAEHLGYPTAFLSLGSLALGSLFIWFYWAGLLRGAERENGSAVPGS
ncbi:MAG: MFS transporter [Candidatus Eremiobacteraeota bacterium]|nr:MFS transporter [Candidatus Eremiobacteraeota bacterium]